MAAGACGQAAAGIPVEELLFKFPEAVNKIIRGSERITIVPRRVMGRNHCRVNYDKRVLIGAKTGFAD